MSKIEILVSMHRPSVTVECELLKTIQVGTSLAGQRIETTYHDNDGDNISNKNDSYSELTAIYWMWKNLKLDYYGLFHYRRYLTFTTPQKNEFNVTPFEFSYHSLFNDAKKVLGSPLKMRKLIENYDLILPMKSIAPRFSVDYAEYQRNHVRGDLDFCLQYLNQHFPEIATVAHQALNQPDTYPLNMFIMKRDLFNEYCQFIFEIITAFDQNHDYSNYSSYQYRVCGFLAERLSNIFFKYLEQTRAVKVKQLQVAYFEKTDLIEDLQPAFPRSEIPIIFQASNEETPYLSVLLRSILHYSNNHDHYDFIVQTTDLSRQNQQLIREDLAEFTNFKLRCGDFAENYDNDGDDQNSNNFQLLIPQIMHNFPKVLFLDLAVCVQENLRLLFNFDLAGKLLGAGRDLFTIGTYNTNLVPLENVIDPQMKHHLEQDLKLTEPIDYFNAQVLIFDLEHWNNVSFSEINQHSMKNMSDLLNLKLQGQVSLLPLAWNYQVATQEQVEQIISKIPKRFFNEYKVSQAQIKIINYNGIGKPWENSCGYLTSAFWKNARTSLFYELILQKMVQFQTSQTLVTSFADEKILGKLNKQFRTSFDRIFPRGSKRRSALMIGKDFIQRKVK